jgi:site-specific recombinase XerD
MALEQVFEQQLTLSRLRSSPLGHLMDGFCESLLEKQFSIYTIRTHLGRVFHLNSWLADIGWDWNGSLQREKVEEYYTAYRERCRARGPKEGHLLRNRFSVNCFCRYLEHKGLLKTVKYVPFYEPLLTGYLMWMKEHQHAGEGTLDIRRLGVGRFLEWLGDKASPEGVEGLTPAEVERYFLDYAKDASYCACHSMQAALRTFFRYALHEGYTHFRLDEAVPVLHKYRQSSVPRGIGEIQARTVLEGIDRTTAAGRRDYAILTMLYTYGVRGCQVRTLRLADIDWSKDLILFRSAKNGKNSLLPLTEQVGESILDYLHKGRPASVARELFLTSRAPYQPLKDSNTFSEIIRRHISAAGIDLRSKGAHIFRHAFATRKVAEGYPFKAVADVLGHRHLSTTYIYTKVDFNTLGQVALEWPEEVR